MLEGVGLVLLVPVVAVVTDGQGGNGFMSGWWGLALGSLLVGSRTAKLGLLLGSFVVLVLLRALVLWHRDVMLARLRIGFVERQRTRLVGRLVGASWIQLSRIRHARINHLLSSDIILAGACVHFMLEGAVSLGMLTMQWLLAFLLAPDLALGIGALVVAAGFLLIPQLEKSRALGQEMAEINLRLATSGGQFLDGLKLAMSQNLQHRFAAEFNEVLGKLMLRQLSFVRQQSRSQLVFATVSSLAGVVAIYVGIGILDTPPPILIVFVLLLVRIGSPAALLQQGAQQFANLLPSYEKIRALERELPSEPVPLAVAALPLHATIEFLNVSYRHPGSPKGVFGLDLAIEAGSFVGITGASGAGKTTFADLLVGLIAPAEGMITLGGRPLTDALRNTWRSAVAYAPQEPFLFHDSIRNNLLWANEAAGEDDIWTALRTVGAERLVSGLDCGLETIIGENGALLAGGERQRLILARALLRKPPLLVLDETTSAIDIAGEYAVLKALAALPWHPTIVLVAHRRESMAFCDLIVEFAEGRIVAAHHSDLCASRAE
ncbi:MAG: ABC transporter ATP-binding protein [Aliidongia sp.]